MRPTIDRPSILSPSEDPCGDAKKIEKQWVVTEKVQVGIQDDDGRLTRCSPLAIQPGDFVDVTVVADISSYAGNESHKLFVDFRPQRIIRLCARKPSAVWDLLGAMVRV